MTMFVKKDVFLLFLAHIAITWRPSSVNFSHFNLLLWNHIFITLLWSFTL